jgi:outer membrane protein OmpA-like peptidoglycan-associated protein
VKPVSSIIVAALACVWSADALACAKPTFFFGPGSALLGPEAAEMANFAFEEFRASRGDKLKIRARVLETGDQRGNMHLAQRRVEAVKNALTRRGVPAQSVVIATRKTGVPAETQVVEIELVEDSTCS